MTGFTGLRNNVTSERFDAGDLETADNLNLDDTGKAFRRDGYTLESSGAKDSLWAKGEFCLVMDGTTLKRRLSDGTLVPVRTGLTDADMAYELAAGDVYYTNGHQTGKYTKGGDYPWGISLPTSFVGQNSSGSLYPGSYLFTVTYLRSTGEESGTKWIGSLDVTTGGIAFTGIPVSTDPLVTHKAIYLTAANSKELHQAAILENSTETYTYHGGNLGPALNTYLKEPPLPGHAVGVFNGRMLIARDGFLYYSEPYAYSLFDQREYFEFDSRITVVAPVIDGVWIADRDRTWFLQGNDIANSEARLMSDYGAIEGSLSHAQVSMIGADGTPQDARVAVWTSQNGICYGFPGGVLINVTTKKYTFPTLKNKAAGFVRTSDGINQYISVCA